MKDMLTTEQIQFLMLVSSIFAMAGLLMLNPVERKILKLFPGGKLTKPLPYCVVITAAPVLLDVVFHAERPAVALLTSASLGLCSYQYLRLYRTLIELKPSVS